MTTRDADQEYNGTQTQLELVYAFMYTQHDETDDFDLKQIANKFVACNFS